MNSIATDYNSNQLGLLQQQSHLLEWQRLAHRTESMDPADKQWRQRRRKLSSLG